MGIGAALSGIGSLVGIGSSIAGMANSGGGGTGTYGGNPNVYIPTGQPAADQMYQNIVGSLNANANLYGPQYGQMLNQWQQNNAQFAAPALTGAVTAGQYGTGTLYPMQAGGAASLYGAGNQVLGTAFDPQSALYNRLQQQTLDQANATNSMYGLAASPYGAGTANQALTNFNIDWQNQQLARQIQGLQGAGKAYSGASLLGQGAYGTEAAATMLPYTTYGQLQIQDPFGYMGLAQQGIGGYYGLPLNALQSYLNLGQSATGLAQQGQAQQFAQNQQYGQNLATALTNPALSNLFNGNSSPAMPGFVGGPTDFFPGGYSDPFASSNYSGGVPLAF